ncbi:MAG TPA: PQQ-dependent dehydrogenase, methanol/ethanol family, partial [Gemmatimonadaceae bacterium]|nr:PQQ-dependent dehydrogenase, methanol/ethanol family [Gemmatimonadaceae bacterium]
DREPGQWLSYGRTYDEQHYSPLEEIDTGNVRELGLAWFADIPLNQGQEAVPLVVDGVIYLASSWSNVFAYDARTGQQLWRYDPKVPREWAVNVCCGVVNRGVAVWHGKVYVGTLDGRLVALDAATGHEVWSVQTFDKSQRYSVTGAVRVVKGKVLVGNSGAEFGVRGYVSAYDAESGKLAWRFYTVPGNPADGFENEAMAMAAKTWSGEWWKLGGGGTPWDAMVYDPESSLLYIGTGNGSPWNQALRSPGGGDNLFLASIVALDPDTGTYRWHYQTAPGETWDFTATQPIVVANLDFGGTPRRVIMQAPKNGFFYVLDAKTGELISADAFAPVNWATGIDKATGKPIQNPATRYDQTGRAAFVTPTGLGAHNWRPMSFSPKTGLVYFGSRHAAQVYLGIPYEKFTVSEVGTNTGVVRPTPPELEAELAKREDLKFADRGAMIGWDPVARKPRWRTINPGNGIDGGTLATAGDLVFAGGGNNELIAYNASTGERLWSFDAQTGVAAGPVSYELDGVQYIAVAAGRGLQPYYQPNYSRLLVFKRGGTASLPIAATYVPPPLNPPASTASADTLARGAELYGQNCVQCHGNNISNFPDLRVSPAIQTQAAFDAIVLGGAREGNGMASFAPALSRGDAAAVREYVVSLARAAKAEEDAKRAAAAARGGAEPHAQ